MTKPIPSDSKSKEELKEKISNGSEDADDYRNLAEMLFAEGKCEEAISLYEQALTLPLTKLKKAEVSMERGWIFYEMGHQTQAQPLAQSALGLLSKEPESVEVLSCRGASQSLLAHCLWSTEENSAIEAARLGLKCLDRVIKSPQFEGKAAAYIDMARLHILLGSPEKAVDLCAKCLEQELKELDRLSCLIVYSQALRSEERLTEAEQTMKEALRYVKGHKGILPGLYLELGLIQRFTDRLAEAQATFQQALIALEADPYLRNDAQLLGDIHLNLAAVSYELGDYKEAIAAYQEVLRQHPKDDLYRRDALLWLGHCYLEIEKHPEARDCYDEVLASPQALDDLKAGAREGIARLNYQLGKYAEAAAAFEEVLSHYPNDDPHNANIMLWLGYCYEAAGERGKAREYFEKVLASPHAPNADKASAKEKLVWNLGKFYYESKKHEQAAAAFEEALNYQAENNSDHWNTLLWLGHCYQAMGIHSRGRDCFEKVLASAHALDSDKASAQKSLGELYYNSGEFEEAVAAFEESLALYPVDDSDLPNLLVWLGSSYEVTGDYAKARDCYEQVLTSPNASEADKGSAQKCLDRLPPLPRKTFHENI